MLKDLFLPEKLTIVDNPNDLNYLFEKIIYSIFESHCEISSSQRSTRFINNKYRKYFEHSPSEVSAPTSWPLEKITFYFCIPKKIIVHIAHKIII